MLTHLRTRISLAAVALLALVAAAPPQPRPQLSLGETIEVSIVNLDVVVTDKAGNRVRGLTQNDFEVLEEGKPQPITNFAEYGNGTAVSDSHSGVESAAGVAPRPQPRTIVIFVDDFHLNLTKSTPMFDAMKEMLRKSVRPGDAVAVISYANGFRGNVQYTDDLNQLIAAIDRIADERRRPHLEDALVAQALSDVQQIEGVAGANEGRSGIRQPIRSSLVGRTSPTMMLAARQQQLLLRRKADILTTLMSTMAGNEGRKVLLFVSHRFSRIAGGEYLFGRQAGPVNLSDRADFDNSKVINRVAQAANTYGVTIYPIYPEGLDTNDGNTSGANAYEILNNESQALGQIAAQTGGLYDWGSQPAAELLPKVTEDFDTYYSLAYRKQTSGEDRVHTVTVKTKNPDYHVRSRQQFVEKSDESKMKERVLAELFRPSTAKGIQFALHIAQPKVKSGKTTLPLTLKIPISLLTAIPQGNASVGEFSVYIASANDRGQLSDVTRQTQPFSIKESELARAKSSSFTYDVDVVIDRDTDRIAIGVVDNVSKEFGLARITVPSGIALAANVTR